MTLLPLSARAHSNLQIVTRDDPAAIYITQVQWLTVLRGDVSGFAPDLVNGGDHGLRRLAPDDVLASLSTGEVISSHTGCASQLLGVKVRSRVVLLRNPAHSSALLSPPAPGGALHCTPG